MFSGGDGGVGMWWLLVSFVIFVAGVWYIYRPSAKRRMNDAGKIPFKEED